MAKKAKITKLQEGMLLNNGSKDVIFPVTVADGVVLNVQDEDSNFGKNLNAALSYLQDNKLGVLDMIKDEEDNLHILAFESKVWYRNWLNSDKDSKYVKYDLNIGKSCTCESGEEPGDEPGDEPYTPDPHITNPILLSPIDYSIDPQHTIYNENSEILLKGQDLAYGIYVTVNDSSSGISFRYEDKLYKGYVFSARTVIYDICSDEGLKLPIYKDISVQYATTTITISSVKEEPEFDPVTIKVEVGQPSRIVIQDEDEIFTFGKIGSMATTLNNTEYRTRRFKVQGVGIIDDTTVALRDEYGLFIDYNTTGEFPQTGQNLTRFTVDANTLNSGIWVYITCLKYNGYAYTMNRVSNCDTVLTISNSTANITNTLGVLFRYLTTPVTPDIIGPGTEEYLSPELTLIPTDDVVEDLQTTTNENNTFIINTDILNFKAGTSAEINCMFALHCENLVNDVTLSTTLHDSDSNNVNLSVSQMYYTFFTSPPVGSMLHFYEFSENTNAELSKDTFNGNTVYIALAIVAIPGNNVTSIGDMSYTGSFILSTKGPTDSRGHYETVNKILTVHAGGSGSSGGTIIPVDADPGVTFEDNEPLDENISAIIRNTTNYNVDSNYIANSTSIITELPNQFMKGVKQSIRNSVTFDHLTELDRLVNLTTIQNNAFSDCTNLQTVVIPYTIETIGAHAFENDTALTSVTFEDTQEHTSRLKTIGIQAFTNCTSLTEVTLPQNLTTIEYGAFWHTGLTSVVIPNSVTYIGSGAFADCQDLEVVDFGEGVVNFADSVLAASSSVTDVYFRANQVVNLMRPMGGRPNVVLPTDDHMVTIHVPEDLISSYEESRWASLSETNIEFVAIEDEETQSEEE